MQLNMQDHTPLKDSEEEYIIKITIDDGWCAYNYEISCDGSKCIREIAENVHKFLGSKKPLTNGKKAVRPII